MQRNIYGTFVTFFPFFIYWSYAVVLLARRRERCTYLRLQPDMHAPFFFEDFVQYDPWFGFGLTGHYFRWAASA
jgi:hypothetical protein